MDNLPERLRDSKRPLRRTDWFNLLLYHLKNRQWDGYPNFSRDINPPPESPRRILVIQLSSIGDVTYTIPSFFALKNSYPEAEIDFISESESTAGVIGHPAITKLWEIPVLDWLNSINGGNLSSTTGELRRLFKELECREYDFIINLHTSPFSAILTHLLAAPFKSGLCMRDDLVASIKGNPLNLLRFYSLKKGRQKLPLRSASIHSLLAAPGYEKDLSYHVWSDKKIKKNVKEMFDSGHTPDRKHVLINTGSRMEKRRWPAKHCASVVSKLLASNLEIGLIGGPGDVPRLKKIEKIVGPDSRLFSWYEKTSSLLEDVLLSDLVDLTITTDSGPLHLISIRNNSCLDLAGNMWVGPWSEKSAVLQAPDKEVASIPPEKVVNSVLELLTAEKIGESAVETEGVSVFEMRPFRSSFWNNFFESGKSRPSPGELKNWLRKMFSLRLWLEKTAADGWESISLAGRKIGDIYSLYWPDSPPELEEDIRPEELTGYEDIDFSAYRKPPLELMSGWLEEFYKSAAE